jgi:hypothetical protein
VLPALGLLTRQGQGGKRQAFDQPGADATNGAAVRVEGGILRGIL